MARNDNLLYCAMPKREKDIDHEIFVGNIPSDFEQETVECLFEKYNVKACTVYHSGKKTFCFMKLATAADVTNAIREMNEKVINGRRLIVRQYEDKRGTSKLDQSICKGSHNLLVTSEGMVPPLETACSFNDISFETPSELQSCNYGHLKFPTSGRGNASLSCPVSYQSSSNSSFSQSNKNRHSSEMKDNSFHLLPNYRIAHSSPNYKEIKTVKEQNKSSRLCTDLDRSLNKSSEKFEYVHCTRNVISYNPRDLHTNEVNNVLDCSSEAVSVQVVNFPFGTTKNQIFKLFEDFSPINVHIDNNKPGSSYTQATVMLPSSDAAEAAIMELDNTMYGRRTLLVSIKDDELDEFADDYDEEEYGSYYYGSDSQCSEQGHHSRSSGEQYWGRQQRQLSGRFNDVHIS